MPTLSTLLRRRRAARTAELAQAKVFGRHRLGHERQRGALSQQASQTVGQSRRRRPQAHSINGSEKGQPLVPGNLRFLELTVRMTRSQDTGRAKSPQRGLILGLRIGISAEGLCLRQLSLLLIPPQKAL